MLPVHRLIGHKEWAPGRKSDPVYPMDWRRSRVAGFRPRTVEDDVPLTEAEKQDIANRTVLALLTRSLPARAYAAGKTVGPAQLQSYLTHTAAQATKAAEGAATVLAETTGLRAAVTSLAQAVAAGKTVTAAELEDAVERAIANAGAALRAVMTVPLVDDGEGVPA